MTNWPDQSASLVNGSCKMTSAIDERLLALLKSNARLSTANIARKLGVARSTVKGRLERLERSGVITGYTVSLGPGARTRRLQAIAMIGVEPQQQSVVERRLAGMPAVITLFTVSGDYDLVAMLAADSTEALDAALDEVRACPGVKATTTSIILTRRIDR